MGTSEGGFDPRTALAFQANAGGSPHHAYRDATGQICLVCTGRSPSGGVAVNEAGLVWLQAQSGMRFVRLTNPVSKFDVTLRLDLLPTKAMREGERGRYAFFDPTDFGLAPPFPAPVTEPTPF